MVIHSDHLVLTILMSVFIDSIIFPNHDLEKVFRHNTQIIANISDDEAGGLNHFGKKLLTLIQEYQDGTKKLIHYIPRYYVDPKFDIETGPLESMEKKYPELPAETNTIDHVPSKEFLNFVQEYQRRGHLVTYANALYGKNHYKFIKEVLEDS